MWSTTTTRDGAFFRDEFEAGVLRGEDKGVADIVLGGVALRSGAGDAEGDVVGAGETHPVHELPAQWKVLITPTDEVMDQESPVNWRTKSSPSRRADMPLLGLSFGSLGVGRGVFGSSVRARTG